MDQPDDRSNGPYAVVRLVIATVISLTDGMRALLTCLIIGCAGPAQAMNWEGHDDWMADAGPALVYEHAAPHAVIVPEDRDRCSGFPAAASGNPYEQIPLDRHDCRAPAEPAEPRR